MAEKIYSCESQKQWNSDYENNLNINWQVMLPDNYSIYKDAYVRTYEKMLAANLKDDIGTYFIQQDGSIYDVTKHLTDKYGIVFDSGDEFSSTGTLNGEKIFSWYFESGEDLFYLKAVDGITFFGVKPGMSESEAISIISRYGFYKSSNNYRLGRYYISWYIDDNGIITEVSMRVGNDYVG